jgi:hypothetical protein
MKLFKSFFLLILFGSFLNITAQPVEPMHITQGSIQVSRHPYPELQQIATEYSIAGSNSSSALTSNWYRTGTMPTFFSNRQAANYIYVFEPSTEARGTIIYYSWSCSNCLLAHQDNQPLSTRFEIKLDDFRVPKFPKTGTAEDVEVIVPFTVTGQVSVFSLNPIPNAVLPVNGSGSARLKFRRLNNGGRRVQLINAYFGFGTQFP